MGSARLEDLLGDSSSYTAMTDREKDYFVKLLQEEMHRREDSGRVEQIRDIVRIEDWINSDYYVGSDQKSIYPYWKDFIVDIFRDTRKDDEKINSVILSGCFTGDTRVSLFDGRELSFLELLDEYGYDGKFWVYSCTSDGVVIPGLAHSVHKTKVSTRIAIVKLDNGEEIRCTPDHRFMLRDGSYVEAKDLDSDLLLMSLKSNEYNVSVRIVDSVEIIDSCVDVYDLEVDTYHNFALSSGVFVHNSIGVGKSCLHGKTKIPTSLGLKEIKELHDLYHNKGKRFKVLSESGFKDCLDVYDNGVDNVYDITLSSGRVLRSTKNHKYRVVRDGKIEWIKTIDITPNDSIVLSRKETPFGGRYFNIKDAYTLGYVLGDGGIHVDSRVGYRVFRGVFVGYQDILTNISDILKYSFSRWFGGCHYNKPKKLKNGNNYITLKGHSTSLTTKLVESGFGYSSANKGIPKFIFECRKEVISAFIRGLMDADGTVGKNGKIGITLKSKSIIYDLASLLSMYGINYTITSRTAKGYEGNIYYNLLIVNNESYIKYYENIGFLEPFKQARLKEYYENIISGKCNRNNRMNVPDVVKVLRDLDSKNHLRVHKGHYNFTSFRDQDNMSLTQLKKFHSCYKDWIEQSDYLKRVCTDDIFFDTVVSISESYEEHTYDLTIDTDHSYCFDGVISHNTIAELIMMRKMYELSCFRNINAMFNLMSKTNIMFLYFSVNQKQAERTGFGEYRALIDNSPYFNENFQRNPRLNSLLVFPEGISYAYGSSASDSIGMSVICSMLDEANFIGGNGPSKDSEKATDLYANIVNRSNSRFIVDGGVNHSLNILVSSATYENSATERQIRLSRNDPHTIVAAPAQWDVKPKNFSKKFFYVFKGSNYLEANIVNSTDDVNNYRVSEGMSKHKYIDGLEDYDSINKVIEELPPHMQSKFLKVPVDLRAGFEANLLRSLQDIGGVSTGSQGKLFSSPMVLQDCIDENRHHPFVSKEIVISTGDDINVKDYLRDDFRLKYPERPRYLHIDQSFRTDSTGISCVYVDSIVEEDGVKKPVFGVDFMLRINPPKPPKKIAIYKIRNFVIYLVNVVGMKIGKLTYDIFNSEESRQILEEMGFNVGYLSVDRTDKPYLDLVEIMYEKRIKLYDYPILRYELLNLLHDRIRRKVDHPKVVTDDGFVEYEGKGNDGVTGTRVGSKDVADSLCGAIQNALQSSVSDAEGNKGTFNDFLMANNIGSYVGIDAPNKLSVEEMIDKQIDDMIDEIEINGGFYR